jgi:hypothetical protein
LFLRAAPLRALRAEFLSRRSAPGTHPETGPLARDRRPETRQPPPAPAALAPLRGCVSRDRERPARGQKRYQKRRRGRRRRVVPLNPQILRRRPHRARPPCRPPRRSRLHANQDRPGATTRPGPLSTRAPQPLRGLGVRRASSCFRPLHPKHATLDRHRGYANHGTRCPFFASARVDCLRGPRRFER